MDTAGDTGRQGGGAGAGGRGADGRSARQGTGRG
jgi:hypothetical protein